MTKPLVGVPTAVLFALPLLSLGLLGGLFLAGTQAILKPIFGALFICSIFAELVVFSVATYAVLRNAPLRSWQQAAGLTLLGAKLLTMFGLFFLAAGAGI